MIPAKCVCKKCWGKWWNDEFESIYDKGLYVCLESSFNNSGNKVEYIFKRNAKIKKNNILFSKIMKKIIGDNAITFRHLFMNEEYEKHSRQKCPYVMEHIIASEN